MTAESVRVVTIRRGEMLSPRRLRGELRDTAPVRRLDQVGAAFNVGRARALQLEVRALEKVAAALDAIAADPEFRAFAGTEMNRLHNWRAEEIRDARTEFEAELIAELGEEAGRAEAAAVFAARDAELLEERSIGGAA